MMNITPKEFYFNSQPHKEADDGSEKDVCMMCISTHSLTRRLTAERVLKAYEVYISTHSHTRRLTGRRVKLFIQ